jgi:hypothetical protein
VFRDSKAGLRGHGIVVDQSYGGTCHQKRGGNCISVTHGYNSLRLFNGHWPENQPFDGVAKLNAN